MHNTNHTAIPEHVHRIAKMDTWLEQLQAKERAAYPSICNNQFIVTPQASLAATVNHILPPTDQQTLQPTHWTTAIHQQPRNSNNDKPTQPVKVQLNCTTINVNTLAPKHDATDGKVGKSAAYRAQLSEAHKHIICMQECRDEEAQKTTSDYLVYSSGCTPHGTHGCGIWLSCMLPFANGPKGEVKITRDNVIIINSQPTNLTVLITTMYFQLYVMSSHAPHSGHLIQMRRKWWADIATQIDNMDSNIPIIWGLDGNVSAGSSPSEAIGQCNMQDECECGTLFHNILLEHNMAIPHTFADSSDGQTYTTPDGTHTSRRDYLAYPETWLANTTHAQVWEEFDMLNVRDDRKPVVADVHILMDNGKKLHRRRTMHYDAKKLESPEHLQHLLWCLGQVVIPSWLANVHAHYDYLVQQVDYCLRTCLPRDKCFKRKPYLSDQAWTIIRQRRLLSRMARKVSKSLPVFVTGQWFHAWKQTTNGSSPDTQAQCQSRFVQLYQGEATIRHFCQRCRATAKTLLPQLKCTLVQDKANYWIETATHYATLVNTSHNNAAWDRMKAFATTKTNKQKQFWQPLPYTTNEDGTPHQTHEEAAKATQQHFSTIELGNETTHQQLLDQTQSRHDHKNHDITLDIDTIPNITETEHTLRATSSNRVGGEDNFVSNFIKKASVQLTRLYHPLFVKIALSVREPVQLKGGEMVKAYKSGSAKTLNNFRGLLMSDIMGKSFHRMQRERLMPYFEKVATDTQWEGEEAVGQTTLLTSYASHKWWHSSATTPMQQCSSTYNKRSTL